MSTRNFNLRIAIALSISFFAITTIDMLMYTGGSLFHPNEAQYIFIGNFYSDLGRYKSFLGKSNTCSMVLFGASMLAASIGQQIYHNSLQKHLGKSKNVYCVVALRIASIFSKSASIGLLCVAATPWDIFFIAHTISVDLAFISMFFANLFFLVAIFLNKMIPVGLLYVKASITSAITLYLFLLRVGPNPFTDERSANIQSLGQKIIVASIILGTLIGSAILMKEKTNE